MCDPKYTFGMYQQQPSSRSRLPRVGGRGCGIDIKESLKSEIMQQSMPDDSTYGPMPVSYQDQPPQYGGQYNNGGGGSGNGGGGTGSISGTITTIPGYGFEEVELYFDSTARDMISDFTNGEIKWTVATINQQQDVKNCIMIKVGKFFFPKIYTDASHPDYFYYRRVFMEITSAPSTQAVLGANNMKFHYEFEVAAINSHAVELIPIRQPYLLTRAVQSLAEFNVRFYAPTLSDPTLLSPVPIPPERVAIRSQVNAGVGYNPIRFSITDGNLTTYVLNPLGAIIAPGLAVVISGFASASPALNAAVNDPRGIYITNIINNTTFEIGAIDGTAATVPVTAQLYIPKNRIAFPVRFTSRLNAPTNFITPVHD